MKAIIYSLVFFSIQIFSANINAQKEWPKSSCENNAPHKQLTVICWQNNILHVIEKPEIKKETRLNKMIKQTRSEVKKMEKSIASVDQNKSDEAGIFHYRKGADGLQEGSKAFMIH